MAGRAVLRFRGAAELVCEKLPQTFVLEPAQKSEVVVGREVPPGGFLLDSSRQSLMISRRHAQLVLVDEGRWKVEDLQSTNGILHNGVRVSEAVLAHGDTITFGGARSTAIGSVPGPKATESIYSFSFETMAPCAAGTDSESSPGTRSRSKSSKSPAGDGIGSAGAGASAAASPEGRREVAAAPSGVRATRAASKGKGKETEEPATTEADTAAGAEECEHATRPIARRPMSPAGATAGTSARRARLPHLLSTAVRVPTLPLQHLRDEDGVLDHRLLGPEEAWPTSDTSCAVSLQGEDGAPGLHVGQLSFTVTEMPRGTCFNRDREMRVEFIQCRGAWIPDASAQPRTTARLLCIFYSDDKPEKKPIAVVEARGGEHQKFWTLFQLALLNQPAKADPKSQHIWEEADLPFQDKKSKSMPRVLLRARMARPEGSADAMPTVTLEVALGPAAFILDRWISAGAKHGNWINEEEYENALVGERPVRALDAFKALRRLLLHMASCEQATGLRLGPDTCEETLNGYAGVRKADVLDKQPPEASGTGSSRPPSHKPAAQDFDLGRLLESISTKGGAAPPSVAAEALGGLRAEALSGLREDCNLYAFQQEGIAWMASREEQGDWLSLHPSWIQLQTAGGTYIYLHKWTGELSARFFPAPRQETCGGMLCDDVGLGKTVQLLGLVLARRPPPDFAVKELPSHTNQVLPIKGTLIVAPEALLPQWESEIRKHTKRGALKACTYLGVGSGSKNVAAAAAAARGAGGSARARSAQLQVEPSAEVEEETGPRVTRQSVRAGDASTSAPHASAPRFEVLARTQRHLFERAAASLEDDDTEVEVEKCDVILCSFETLRDELRKTQRTHGGMDLPLGALGFWRVILDEAQLVSQSTSRAAVVCSDLWRRHAWVATGTPINAKIDELHGLLAFLGTAPFHEGSTFQQLLLKPYKEREPSALYKMRTLFRALCLRRSKKDPSIASQIAIPPLSWETRLLTFSGTERAVYACAAEQLRRSHAAFRRASASRTSKSRARARLLGQLNGDLTRLRQVACHPSVVNEERLAARAQAPAHSSDGARLPQTVVLARLIARAAAERDFARAALLKARVKLYVAEQRASRGKAVPPSGDPAEVMQEIEECEAASQREADKEPDRDAAKSLRSNAQRWQKLREELRDLLVDKQEGMSKCGADADVANDTTPESVAGSRGKRKAGDGDVSDGRAGKKSKMRSLEAEPSSSLIVEYASKAVVKADAQHRQKLQAWSYLFGKRSAAPSAAGRGDKEEDEDMDDDEDGGARGKAKECLVETCPICLDERGAGGNSWSITACGHAGCFECMTGWLSDRKTCPICKQMITTQGLFEVEDDAPEEVLAAASSSSAVAARERADDGFKDAVEEYGTKIAVLVQELGAVHAKGGKAVVFSAWTRLLNLAGSALSAHGIPTASLVGSSAAKRQALEAFSADASILLIPLFGGASGAGGGGAAGLTLTQATVAYLLEPALQPGIERQAAGRIARIGQSKETKLIRLIVDKTVEKKILEWQQIRMAHAASANNALTLNDFAMLVG